MTRRRLALIAVWTLPSLVFVTATAIVYSAYRIPPPERLGDADRAAVIAPLRAAVDGTPPSPCAVHRPIAGAVSVTLWSNGRPIARADVAGDDLGTAIDGAAAQLRATPAIAALKPPERTAARVQVDVLTGTGPLGEGNWVFDRLQLPGLGEMLAINSGLEGIGVRGAQPVLLLPHELVAGKMLQAKRPSAALQDFAMGADWDKIRATLQQKARVSELDPATLYRFRTDTFVERPAASRDQPPLALYRGIPEPPKLTSKALRDGAIAGGRYLVAHMAPNGRYIYEHDLSTGVQTNPASPSYSMPRHAGTTYFLSELYRITKEPWLEEPIKRAFKHLAELMSNGRCTGTTPDGTPMDCVMDRTERDAALGSTALAVVALAEFQRATGSKDYLPTAQKLGAFILWMQRPDGSFRHHYDPATKRADDVTMDLYYSGEAALALARMWVVTGDKRYGDAAAKALDWLVDWYDFFMGGFFYGEEHWTCIASEALFDYAARPKWRDFCHGYGAFLRAQQPQPGEHGDQDDYAGAYGFTPFLAPSNTPAGSRTEAMISAYLLGEHHGTPDPDVRRQIGDALQYVLGQQIRPDSDFAVVGAGLGGMPQSPIDRSVRIDFVQHTCSAMIRASQFIEN